MSRRSTASTLEADVSPADVWEKAYAGAEAWSRWNTEIKRARLDGPLALGAKAKIVFGTGLRLRFRVVEFEAGCPDPTVATDYGTAGGTSPARCTARRRRSGSGC
jgi:hypothetical protein